MNYIDTIGYIGSFLVMIAFLPQAWQVIKTKSVEDVSLASYSILVSGAFVWIIYGTLKEDWPIVLTNVVLFAVQLVILVCKLKYGKK